MAGRRCASCCCTAAVEGSKGCGGGEGLREACAQKLQVPVWERWWID